MIPIYILILLQMRDIVMNNVNIICNRIIIVLLVLLVVLICFHDIISNKLYEEIVIINEYSKDNKHNIILKRKKYINLLKLFSYEKNNAIDLYLVSDDINESTKYFTINNLPKNVKEYSYTLRCSKNHCELEIHHNEEDITYKYNIMSNNFNTKLEGN